SFFVPWSPALPYLPSFPTRRSSDLARVLALAEDESLPLLERAKFLAIFSENLDEFFQVRVAGLKDQLAAGLGASADGDSPSEQLEAIRVQVELLFERQVHVFLKSMAPA